MQMGRHSAQTCNTNIGWSDKTEYYSVLGQCYCTRVIKENTILPEGDQIVQKRNHIRKVICENVIPLFTSFHCF